MGLNFKIEYHELVIKEDISKLSKTNKKRTKKAIEGKLLTEPELFGKPLRKSLKGYRKLRVGDYRIVFRINKNIIKIFLIAHRSIVYQKTENR